ncbi:MAG TPA: glycosyltransferase [Pseudonocardiaceae bacterium]|jgi:glycosyltransferase involved in cell wall biosynthesis|nr:glycosyltransferase [Pseudonocardiaceae bacterium]
MGPQATFAASDAAVQPRRILVCHVHGSWTTAFVQGRHEYLLPVLPDGSGGRSGRDWPAAAREVRTADLRDADVDLVVLQRVEEIELVGRWLGRQPGRDVPAVFVEHNTPRADVPNSRHPLADRADLTVVHVTPFNDLMWDAGSTPTTVIEHGIPDPGYRYTGELPRAAVVVNEPLRRWRVTGTDLLPRFATTTALDLFGIGVAGTAARLGLSDDRLRAVGDLPSARLYDALARRRLYLHPVRWTSLGLSLIEAMHLGMPIVGLATAEAVMAVPADAGVLSTDVDELTSAARRLINEPALAAAMGKQAREAALGRYGLPRFLAAWDRLIERTARRHATGDCR